MSEMSMISATRVVKTYRLARGRSVTALDGLDLTVERGEVRAMLGPNGAGKSTAVQIFTTLTVPTSGRATVAGIDVAADPARVRRMIGASGQSAAIDERLTGFENLLLIGMLNGLSRRGARERAADLIEQFDLVEAGDRRVKEYSGGMRRRVDIAGAILAQPAILFLDEPTTGLDPRSRQAVWDLISRMKAQGTTVLLTTQYLEEADRLADTISVVDHGRVIAEGTADQLKAQVGSQRAEFTLHSRERSADAITVLRRMSGSEPSISANGKDLSVAIAHGPRSLTALLIALDEADVELVDAGVRQPTLDDVFFQLTGAESLASIETEALR